MSVISLGLLRMKLDKHDSPSRKFSHLFSHFVSLFTNKPRLNLKHDKVAECAEFILLTGQTEKNVYNIFRLLRSFIGVHFYEKFENSKAKLKSGTLLNHETQ